MFFLYKTFPRGHTLISAVFSHQVNLSPLPPLSSNIRHSGLAEHSNIASFKFFAFMFWPGLHQKPWCLRYSPVHENTIKAKYVWNPLNIIELWLIFCFLTYTQALHTELPQPCLFCRATINAIHKQHQNNEQIHLVESPHFPNLQVANSFNRSYKWYKILQFNIWLTWIYIFWNTYLIACLIPCQEKDQPHYTQPPVTRNAERIWQLNEYS